MKRVKHRYLAIQIDSSYSFHPRDIIDQIWNSIHKLYGEYGASKISLRLIDNNQKNSLLIIRIDLLSLNLVRSSIATITSINNKQVSLLVISISGTIKALKKKLSKKISY